MTGDCFDRDYDGEPLDNDPFVWVRPCTGCCSYWYEHPEDRPILFCLKCEEPLGHYSLVEREPPRGDCIRVVNPGRGFLQP